MNTYENALRQLDELIAHLGKQPASEAQSTEIVRLKTIKRMLSPHDQATVDKVDRYYQKHLSK